MDYSKFDSNNPRDILHERFIHSELESQQYEKLMTFKFMQVCASQGYSPPWDKDGKIFVDNVKATTRAYKDVGTIITPWLDWKEDNSSTIKEAVALTLMEKWERVFGKLDSPEVQKKLKSYVVKDEPVNKPIALNEEFPKGARWVYR